MGNNHSSGGSYNLDDEIEYLTTVTSLTGQEVRELHQEYSGRNSVSKKEFLKEFQRAFPRLIEVEKKGFFAISV